MTVKEKSIIYLAFLSSLLCVLNTSANEAIPLITVKENTENNKDYFILNPDAISMIEQLSSPVKIIAAIGDARVGKSTALNSIHYILSRLDTSAFHTKNVEGIFKTGNTMEAVTRGVWISALEIPGKHGMENIILLDVEGTDLGDDTVIDKLSIFTALTSSCLTLFMKEFPSSHILDFLYKIVRLSEEAFGKKESEHFPQLTAVLRGALAPPESYDSIDRYIKDSLVEPKWKDKSDEKRKVIGKRFPRESISVFDVPLIPNPQYNFQNITELSRNGYLNAIENLTAKLLNLPEKKTLNGALMDGETLADLAQRLVDVMNDHQKWSDLNPNFYELFEQKVCRISANKHIQPVLRLSSQNIERQRHKAFNNFKSNCKLEKYVLYVDEVIQSTLEERRELEEMMRREDEKRQREKEEERERDKTVKTGILGTIIGGIVGAAGYAFLAPLLSDIQLKENITVLNNSEYETIGLRGVEWVWNQEAEKLGLSGKESGVVAQEVELLYPWAVIEGHDGYKRVNYLALRLLVLANKCNRNSQI
ncbi:uncharacterized protein LOC116298522 [Actinia tenebrosa]|uniref:Uncharacterized protein LOC116298522 n=1 Tax=Actinia tenebrosa TaxID=6105 RepID=A0A6P8I2W6_ACTTE|nr:uncharacterized protein LOC116298522 [Actinia tenebrosa]